MAKWEWKKKAELQKGEPGAVGDPPRAGSMAIPPNLGVGQASPSLGHWPPQWGCATMSSHRRGQDQAHSGEGTKVRQSPGKARWGQVDESLLLFQILQKAGCAQEQTGWKQKDSDSFQIQISLAVELTGTAISDLVTLCQGSLHFPSMWESMEENCTVLWQDLCSVQWIYMKSLQRKCLYFSGAWEEVRESLWYPPAGDNGIKHNIWFPTKAASWESIKGHSQN